MLPVDKNNVLFDAIGNRKLDLGREGGGGPEVDFHALSDRPTIHLE